MIKIIILLVMSTNVFAQSSIPVCSTVSDGVTNIRVFKKYNDFNFMFQYSGITHEERNDETLILIGGKYRFHPKMKVGAYVGSLKGARHNDDWIKSGDWQWSDTTDRSEVLAIGELILRDTLDYIYPRTVAEIRFRYENNFDASEQSLKIRPTINTTFNRGAKPFVTVNLSHEVYRPLNFGTNTIYGSWTYFGALFHLTGTLKIGPFLAIGYDEWTDSSAFSQNVAGEHYESRQSAKVLGFNVNIYAD